MFGSLDISTSALVAQRTRLEVISANLANAESVASFAPQTIDRPVVHVEAVDPDNMQEIKVEAPQNFQRVLLFSGLDAGSRDVDMDKVLAEILTVGIQKRFMREEVFCQLLKQLTPPKSLSASSAAPSVRDRTAALLCCCLNSFAPPANLLDFVEYTIDQLKGPRGRGRTTQRHRFRQQLRFALHRTLTVGSLKSVPTAAVLRHALRSGRYLFDGPREHSLKTVRVDYDQLYTNTSGLSSVVSYDLSRPLSEQIEETKSAPNSLLDSLQFDSHAEAKATIDDLARNVYVAIDDFDAATPEELPLKTGDQVYLIGLELPAGIGEQEVRRSTNSWASPYTHTHSHCRHPHSHCLQCQTGLLSNSTPQCFIWLSVLFGSFFF